MPAVVPEPSQARIASTPASQCPPGKICAAKAFHNKKGEIKKGYVGKYPRKYGLIWYSTSILGSWNSHRIWSALAAKYLKFTTHHTCQLMAIPQQQLGPIGIRHHYHHFLHMFAHGSKSSSSMLQHNAPGVSSLRLKTQILRSHRRMFLLQVLDEVLESETPQKYDTSRAVSSFKWKRRATCACACEWQWWIYIYIYDNLITLSLRSSTFFLQASGYVFTVRPRSFRSGNSFLSSSGFSQSPWRRKLSPLNLEHRS